VYVLPEDGHQSGPKHEVVQNKIERKNIVAYGGFKKSISGYTRNRMQNPTIKLAIIMFASRDVSVSLRKNRGHIRALWNAYNDKWTDSPELIMNNNE
jgi:hypothetical protein